MIKTFEDLKNYIKEKSKNIIDKEEQKNVQQELIQEFITTKIRDLCNFILEKTKHIENEEERQYAQINLLNEYICKNVVYDIDSYEYLNSHKNKKLIDDDIYSGDYENTLGFKEESFFFGKCVCKSIESITSKVMNKLGIKNISVRSEVETFGHIWSIIKIGTKEMMVDFTASMTVANIKDGKITKEEYIDLTKKFGDNIIYGPYVDGVNNLFKRDNYNLLEYFNLLLKSRLESVLSCSSLSQEKKDYLINNIRVDVVDPTYVDYECFDEKIEGKKHAYNSLVPNISFLNGKINVYPYGKKLCKLKGNKGIEEYYNNNIENSMDEINNIIIQYLIWNKIYADDVGKTEIDELINLYNLYYNCEEKSNVFKI